MSNPAEPCNIAAALSRMARQQPDAIAMRMPKRRSRSSALPEYEAISYAELDSASNRAAAALIHAGIVRGTKTALMVRPGRALFVLMFALFKVGAVPVLIDPGISRSALKECLNEAAPTAFIGIPLAQLARWILGWARRSVRTVVTVGGFFGFGGSTLEALLKSTPVAAFQAADTRADELAAILFTSGSTGVPKGVEYTHGHFAAQIELLREAFDLQPGAVNMPTFPPFALFDPALGLTSVIPDMDPTRPASADPVKLIAAMERYDVGTLFGSPALLDTLSRYCETHHDLLRVTRVMSAGAPVSPRILARMYACLPDDAKVFTPYGATECLPVSVIEGREVLNDTRAATERGAGTCVGRPLAANTVRIIGIDDAPIATWSEAHLVAAGTVGEITVAGPTVTHAYHARPAATQLAKIRETLADGSGRIVHRMGDTGYFDAQGRLWFCGRKSQRVRSAQGDLQTEQVEPIFNTVAGVRRTALVGVQQKPVLCVEVEARARDQRERIEAEIRNLAAQFEHTRGIGDVLFHPAFPVDIRHNAKIGREALARWAAQQLG